MTLEEFSNKFLLWTEEKIESKKSDGWPVCPYARRARLTDAIQFIDSRNDVASFETFDRDRYEIGICYLGDDADISLIEPVLLDLKEKNPDLLYFTSTPTSGFFAQNFTKCVFIQLANDITEKRDYLHTTNYYASWPEEYYKSIISSV